MSVTYRPPQIARAPSRGGTRNKELIGLLAAGAFIGAGLWLVFDSKAHILADADRGLSEGRILHLSARHTPASLRPALSALRNQPESDRALAERELAQWLNAQPKPLSNVGRLSSLRITSDLLEKYPRSQYFRGVVESAEHRKEQQEAQYSLYDKWKARWREMTQGATVPSVRVLNIRTLSEAKPHFVVRTPAEFRNQFAMAVLFFFTPFLAAHIWFRIRRFGGDPTLLPLLLLLTGIGFIYMVTLRDPVRDTEQWRDFTLGVMAGGLLLAVIATTDVLAIARNFYALPLAMAALLFLLLVIFGTGPGGSGVRLNLFGVQPIEFIKVLIAFFTAGYVAREWRKLRHLTGQEFGWLSLPRRSEILPLLVCLAVALAFLFLSGDLGPALVLTLTFLSIYCLTRRTVTPALLLLGVLITAVWLGYTLRFPEYVARRVDMWIDPWRVALGRSMQLANSYWALASGGARGAGFEFAMPERIEAAHTDLVFAGIGEVLGFAGIALVFVAYAFLFYRFLRIARNSDIFGFYLGVTLSLLLAVQLILIAGGTMGLVPLTGVVAPFLSYGRSSMLVNLFIVGVLLSISNRPSGEADREFGPQMRGFGLILGGCAVILVVRAATLQVYAEDDRMARAVQLQQWTASDPDDRQQLELRFGPEYLRIQNPRLLEMARRIPRGTVTDRNGVPIATSKKEELSPHAAVYTKLGFADVAAVSDSNGRYYPFGNEGYFLVDDARKVAEEQLRGYGTLRELVPLWRHRLNVGHAEVRKILDRNRDVQLTIDMRIQLAASRTLASSIRKNKSGAAVILHASTGEILALAMRPLPSLLAGDPEGPAASEGGTGINLARLGRFPPGSSFKLVTAMAALRKNPELYRQKHRCDPLEGGRVGQMFSYNKRRYTVRDFPGDPAHGDIAMHEALVISCNAYFGQFAAFDVGAESLRQTAAIFGISTDNPNVGEPLEVELPRAGYGQGEVTVTPLQMAEVAATLANGGTYHPSWLVHSELATPKEERAVLKPEAASLITAAMRDVVTRGTARGRIPADLSVAGKTGTAQWARKRTEHAWFVGFSPYQGQPDRRLAFAVVLTEAGSGGSVAAPAAAQIVTSARAVSDEEASR